MEGAEKFFKRIKVDGFEPNVVTYGILIKGYAKVNDLETMMKKYEEMRVNGMKANQTIFTTIMDAYGKNMDFGNAVVWYKEMESSGVPPDQKAKNILLSLAKTAEEQMEAYQLVGQGNHHLDELNAVNGNNYIGDSEDDDVDEDDDDEDVEQIVLSVENEDELIVSDGAQVQKLHMLNV